MNDLGEWRHNLKVPRSRARMASTKASMAKNFALLGVGGFVAPRHLQAIKETGNTLVAACDPKDSVGIMDRYFPEASFFTEFERFDRFLEKRRRIGPEQAVHWVSVCSPNYLHDAHVRLALRLGADAICEKPLVINPWNLDALAALEQETGRRVFSILQLRLLPHVIALREKLALRENSEPMDVVLTYVTRRGRWYHASWKGDSERSGGLAMNIGVHLFDLMVWLFGDVQQVQVHLRDRDRVAGCLELARARVRWFLSVNGDDVPPAQRDAGKAAWRTLAIDGVESEFSEGFTDLHTRAYAEVLDGRGFGIEEARPAIQLAYRIRTAPVVAAAAADRHPLTPPP